MYQNIELSDPHSNHKRSDWPKFRIRICPKANFSTIDSITASRGIPYRFTMHQSRIVITGVGLTSPNGNSLEEYRKNLLDGVARIPVSYTHLTLPTTGSV